MAFFKSPRLSKALPRFLKALPSPCLSPTSLVILRWSLWYSMAFCLPDCRSRWLSWHHLNFYYRGHSEDDLFPPWTHLPLLWETEVLMTTRSYYFCRSFFFTLRFKYVEKNKNKSIFWTHLYIIVHFYSCVLGPQAFEQECS